MSTESAPDTVAWCPGCRRYIQSENEATHARTQHIRPFDGAVASRYRRVSRALVGGDSE